MAETDTPTLTAETSKGGFALQPFTVEFGDEYGRTMTINSLTMRVRGSFDRQKLTRQVGEAMGQMPRVPGQRMRVEPRHRRYTIFDPLANDPATLSVINRVKENAPAIATGSGKLVAVPETESTLNADQFKTLVLDLIEMQQGKMLTVVDGRLPSAQQAEDMPGRKLNDPWSTSSRKPKYEDEVDEYNDSLERRGQ